MVYTAAGGDTRVETSEDVPIGLVACEYCDLLHRERALRPNEKARCSRCGGLLYRDPPNAIEHALALTVAALALWVVANVFPFLRVSLEGQVQTNTIAAGVVDLWSGDARLLAGLILLTTIVAPLLQLLGMLYGRRRASGRAWVPGPCSTSTCSRCWSRW
jgi:uncharacterized paraquat-inducible protein A